MNRDDIQALLDKGSVRMLPVNALNSKFDSRRVAGEDNTGWVEQLRDAYTDDALSVPPLIAYPEGDGTYTLLDGRTRRAAAKSLNMPEVRVNVLPEKPSDLICFLIAQAQNCAISPQAPSRDDIKTTARQLIDTVGMREADVVVELESVCQRPASYLRRIVHEVGTARRNRITTEAVRWIQDEQETSERALPVLRKEACLRFSKPGFEITESAIKKAMKLRDDSGDDEPSLMHKEKHGMDIRNKKDIDALGALFKRLNNFAEESYPPSEVMEVAEHRQKQIRLLCQNIEKKVKQLRVTLSSI